MKKQHYIFLLLIIIYLSCSKSAVSPENETFKLLNKIIADGKLLYEYIYDANNKLILFKMFHNDSCTYTESYQYDFKGRLSKRFYDGFVETYYYNKSGVLTSYTKYYEATNKAWSEEYHYNSNGQIQSGITYYNGEKTGYITYKNDSAGNTIERKEHNDENNFLLSEFRFEFDDTKNPFSLNFPMEMIKKNNIIKCYNYLAIMSAPPPHYESVFEYDSEMFPIKETRIFTNYNNSVVYEYIYLSRK